MVYSVLVNLVAFSALTAGLGAWSAPESVQGWIGLALAGLASTLRLLASFAASRHISPSRATMISKLEPLLGILVAVAAQGERHARWKWLGVG